MSSKKPSPKKDKRGPFVYFFDEINMDDVGLVGGKNASLGEMFRNLGKRGVKVPDGFAVGSDAYWHFIDSAGLRDFIREELEPLDVKDVNDPLRPRTCPERRSPDSRTRTSTYTASSPCSTP
jgi:pyruvate,water dikinase